MAYSDKTLRPPRTLTDREVKLLLKVTGENRRGFRDHMIISLALGCGLRESEIIALDYGDVATVDGKPRRTIQLKVFKRAAPGSDGADQRIRLPDATYYKLEKFLAAERRFRQLTLAGIASQPLFMSLRRRRLSSRQVRTMFRRWQQRARFDVLYRFHELRHTAITNVRKRSTIKHAQLFARHANIKTTARYDHVSDQEMAATVKDLPA